MAKHYVYSTLTNSQNYTNYSEPPEGGQPQAIETVRIEGGANIANKNLVTPQGVMTAITDEQYEILKRNFVFNQHVKGGHIVVKSNKTDADVVANKDMEKRDGSAPVTPELLKSLKLDAKPMDSKSGRMVA